MADYMLSVNIGARDLRQLAIYKHYGVVHVKEKKLLSRKYKWQPRYVVICKGHTGTWNLVCYLDHLANKAEVIYSMLELESVKEYGDAAEKIIGFRIKFEKPLAPLLFSCDTRDSQLEWIEQISSAIIEAHRFSADSAYASGGSVCDSQRLSKAYSSIDDSHIEDTESRIPQDTIPEESTLTRGALDKPRDDTNNSKDDFEESINDCYEDSIHQNYVNMASENHTLYEIPTKRPTQLNEINMQEVETYPVQESKGMVESLSPHRKKTINHNTVRDTITNTNTCTRMESLKSKTQSNCAEDNCNENTDVKRVDQDYRKTLRHKDDNMIQEKPHKVVSEIKAKFQGGQPSTDPHSADRNGQISSPHTPRSFVYRTLTTSNRRHTNTSLGQSDNSEESDTSHFMSVRGHGQTQVSHQPTTDPEDTTFENRSCSYSRESGTQVHDSSRNSYSSNSSRDSDISKYEDPEPDYANEKVFERQEYYCAEKKKIKRYMANTSIGTFLVRPGIETGKEIVVMTPFGLKYFRIFERDVKYRYSLYKSASIYSFPSMDALLFYYYHNVLPSDKFEVKLERGYKSKNS